MPVKYPSDTWIRSNDIGPGNSTRTFWNKYQQMKSIALLFLIIPALLNAQTESLRKKHFNITKGIGIEGYDPVSYFNGEALEGDSKLPYTHQGITYLFSSPANLNKFKSSPEKYEPAYGGWCAFAMGETGEKVKIDPRTFKILEGRLYLFYNFWGSNTLEDWNENERKLKEAADRHWKNSVK